MADKDLLVIKKSMDLVEHTKRLTNNPNQGWKIHSETEWRKQKEN